MRLLLDEQISGRVAERLRSRGHDALAVVEEPRLRGLADATLFELAQGDERAIVTYNYLDFISIAREWAAGGRRHHGLVVVQPIKLPSREVSRLANELERFLAEFEPYPSFEAWLPLP